MIRIRALTHTFGTFTLTDVDLTIEAGAYGVLLGPSGAGKSLLLSLIAGADVPTAGSIHLGERDVTRLPPEHRRVGMVFQKSSLFPHLSVTENIAYGLAVGDVPTAEQTERIDELVAVLGIEDILPRPVATLSGGEAQKIALARALAVRPSVLLLDEPLAPVDHNARADLQNALADLHRRWELTTLHVTHSRDEARALGDTCAVMDDGRIMQFGPFDEVFARPGSSFVARFLGVPFDGGSEGGNGP